MSPAVWKTITGIKDLFKQTYFSLSDPHWRWTHIKSNNPYLTGGVVKHTQLCLNVRPKQGHPAFLIRPFRCGTLAITHSFQGDGTSHSQGGTNQTALCPWRKKRWQKQACWKWVIWIWLIGMTFNRPSSSLRDHDQSISPMICSHNHCITQYHGNPQPSCLGVITHISGVQNLHVSWFWGPRVVPIGCPVWNVLTRLM